MASRVRFPGVLRRRLHTALAAVVAATATLTVLTGCSSNSLPAGTLVEEDWYPTSTPQGAALQWLYEEYHRTHPDITIKRTIVPGATNLMPKLLSQATINSLPDIAVVDNPFLPAVSATGKLQNVEGDLHGGSSAYLPGQKAIATGPSGKLNGIFTGVVTLAIFYNKDMFAAAGIKTIPKTWPEFLSVAKRLTRGKVHGFVFGGGQDQCATWQFNPWQWSAGGKDEPLDSPGDVKALAYWRSLITSGAVSKSVANSCQDDTYQQFAQGQVAMMENGAWDIAPLAKTKIHYGIFSIPVPAAGQKLIAPLGGEMFTVPTTGDSAREKAAHDFLKWTQKPSVLMEFDRRLGYIPAQSALWPRVKKSDPRLTPFVDALPAARGRTVQVTAKYPQWSQAMSTAIGQVILGQKPPLQALQGAQKEFNNS